MAPTLLESVSPFFCFLVHLVYNVYTVFGKCLCLSWKLSCCCPSCTHSDDAFLLCRHDFVALLGQTTWKALCVPRSVLFNFSRICNFLCLRNSTTYSQCLSKWQFHFGHQLPISTPHNLNPPFTSSSSPTDALSTVCQFGGSSSHLPCRGLYCPPQDLIRSGQNWPDPIRSDQNFQMKFASYCQPNCLEIFWSDLLRTTRTDQFCQIQVQPNSDQILNRSDTAPYYIVNKLYI